MATTTITPTFQGLCAEALTSTIDAAATQLSIHTGRPTDANEVGREPLQMSGGQADSIEFERLPRCRVTHFALRDKEGKILATGAFHRKMAVPDGSGIIVRQVGFSAP